MTTPKNLIIPGTRVVVSHRAKLTNVGPMILSTSGFMVGKGLFYAPNGAILEILSKPKKSPAAGFKYVEVRCAGQDFWAYYIHVRYDTTPV